MLQLHQDVANTRHADRLREANDFRRSSQFRTSRKAGRVRQLFRSVRPQVRVAATAC